MSGVIFDRNRSRTGRPRKFYVEKCKRYYEAEIYSVDERVSINEAAEFLGISKRTLYRKLRRHEVPNMRYKNNYWFSVKSLLKFIEELGKNGKE